MKPIDIPADVQAFARRSAVCLKQEAKWLGGKPAHWFSVAEPVPIAGRRLDVFLEKKWQPAKPDELAAAWAEGK